MKYQKALGDPATKSGKIEPNKIESFYIYEHKKIDLSTFEARVSLKDELNEINRELQEELKKLKRYIKDRYSLDDLIN